MWHRVWYIVDEVWTCLYCLCPTEKHLVLLRDGRTLIGYLRSIDQFGTNHSIISLLILFAQSAADESQHVWLAPLNATLCILYPLFCVKLLCISLTRFFCPHSQFSFSSDSWTHPRGEEIWRHPQRNLHSERRKCSPAGRDSEWTCPRFYVFPVCLGLIIQQ